MNELRHAETMLRLSGIKYALGLPLADAPAAAAQEATTSGISGASGR